MILNKCVLQSFFYKSKVAVKVGLTLLFTTYVSTSFAEYRPSETNEQTIETITVKADGTNEQIYESTDLIETEKGIDDSQEDISYISSIESIEVIEAYTLQADSKKLKVPKSAIRTTNDPISNGAPMFSDTKHKIIIFPDVKVGSRLYFKTKTVQHNPQFKGHFYQSRFFSPHYRYRDYQINLIVSDKLPVQVDSNGMQGGLIKEANHQRYYHYVFKQDTALPPEDDEIDIQDFTPYFMASSFKDQVDLGRTYQVGAHPKTRVTPTIQRIADELTLGISDKRLQAKVLYHWVCKNIHYVSVSLGNGGVVPHVAKTILANRYGDCKDHAAILEALLSAKGIESSPVLINLGEAYKLPKLAVIAPQNHVINYIPSLDLYLDSTSQFAPFGSLPAEDMDKPVILTALNKIGHTPSTRAEDNVLSSKTNIMINEDGSMTGTSHITMTGTTGISYRASQYDDIGTDDEELVRDRLLLVGETGHGTILATDPSDLDKPFEENTTFKIDPVSNFPGPGAMTIPVGVSKGIFALMAKSKPRDSRNFPFICSSSTIDESYLIKFPTKTKITRIPEGVMFENNGIKYSSEYRLVGNTLEVLKHYQKQNPSFVCSANDTERQKGLFKIMQRDMMSQVFYE